MSVRNRFSERVPVILENVGDGMVKPEFKQGCNINSIISRYKKTGIIPFMHTQPLYGDFTNSMDYQESLNLLIRAQEQFDGLPSQVRKRFGNDPKEFLDFMNNPDEALFQEKRRLGLMAPEEPALNPQAETKEE